MDHLDRVRIAYKKLKSSVFFDKTQLPLRDKITLFETGRIEKQLSELSTALFKGEKWAEYENKILNSMDILVYPKKLVSIESDTAIFNGDSVPVEVDKPQYFIDLSVEGHILSVLWVLSIGLELDKNSGEDNPDGMYEHSYGNRLRKKLINPETEDITYSPGLFEPYFSQYESWRDYGLEQAKNRLDDKKDALILTLDFKSFYYSVDLKGDVFESLLCKIPELKRKEWHSRINNFVFHVIEKYSNLLRACPLSLQNL